MTKIFSLVVFMVFTLSGLAQTPAKKTETISFKVKGNCESCKDRIENAADIKGVKLAQWDEEKQLLTVTYSPTKVTAEDIKKAVLKTGHDVDDVQGDEKNYQGLPQCCKFRDSKCNKKE